VRKNFGFVPQKHSQIISAQKANPTGPLLVHTEIRLLHGSVPVQSALLLLRSSINASPTYLFRTLPHDITREASRRFSSMIRDTLCTKLDIPSFASLPQHGQLSLALPVNKGGLGIPLTETSPDAG
jgi:hypothetical protein